MPASAVLAQPGGHVVDFAPHRAVYDITLARAANGSGVADMSGLMVYELVGSRCDGYTQNMRFATRMTTNKGRRQLNDLITSSWEDGRGGRLRFNSSQFQDQKLVQATQGDAGRKQDGGTIDVNLTKPQLRKLALKQGTYFPMQHATELIQSARAGRTLFAAKLYDGSDKGEKVYDTNALIGRVWKPGDKPLSTKAKDAERLIGLSSWPVSISYYEPGSEKLDAVPVYEMSFRYFDNGVTTKLTIDYGDFAIDGKLRELTFLEKVTCDAE